MRKEIKIRDRRIGEDYPLFIIAECGVTCNYDMKITKGLIDVARDCTKTGEKKFYAASVSDTVSWDATKAGFRKAFNDPSKISDAWVTRKVDFSNIVGRDKEAALAIDQYVRGRKVRGLLDRELSAGDHVLMWDGRADGGNPAPSGVYFYRIEGPGLMEARRVVWVR